MLDFANVDSFDVVDQRLNHHLNGFSHNFALDLTSLGLCFGGRCLFCLGAGLDQRLNCISRLRAFFDPVVARGPGSA